MYSSLFKTVFLPPTAENKTLRYGIERNTLQKVYRLPFVVLKEINLKMFQYEVVHNVLPTRSTLLRDGIVDNATCNLCNDEEKALYHLLIDCTSTTRFWTLFEE